MLFFFPKKKITNLKNINKKEKNGKIPSRQKKKKKKNRKHMPLWCAK